MNNNFSSQRGQSIIEVLIATLVVGMVMVAIAAVLTMSVKNTAEGKYRNVATSEGQQVLEIFRRERVRLGWNAFHTAQIGGEYCINSLPTAGDELAGFLAQNSGACEEGYPLGGTAFTRDVLIQKTAEEVVVVVNVGWLDGDQTREVVLEQEFREYQQ